MRTGICSRFSKTVIGHDARLWLVARRLAFADGVRRGLRKLATNGLSLSGYGIPDGLAGFAPGHLLGIWREQLIASTAAQVLLTHGAGQGLELAARALIEPGDIVLVDDPAART